MIEKRFCKVDQHILDVETMLSEVQEQVCQLEVHMLHTHINKI